MNSYSPQMVYLVALGIFSHLYCHTCTIHTVNESIWRVNVIVKEEQLLVPSLKLIS